MVERQDSGGQLSIAAFSLPAAFHVNDSETGRDCVLTLHPDRRLVEEYVYRVDVGRRGEILVHTVVVAKDIAASTSHVRIPACDVGECLKDAEGRQGVSDAEPWTGCRLIQHTPLDVAQHLHYLIFFAWLGFDVDIECLMSVLAVLTGYDDTPVCRV